MKSNKIVQIIFFSLIFILGCNRNGSQRKITESGDFPQTITVNGEPVESMKHYVINGMSVIDSFLIISDMKQEKPIFVYSTDNLELLGNLSSVGQGPGEFESPIFIQQSELFNSFLNVYDVRLGVLTRIDIANSIETNKYVYSRTPINDVWNENRPQRVFFETPNFSCLEIEGAWFTLFKEESNSFIDIPFPNLDFELKDERMNYYIFNPEICYNPALDKIAVSSLLIGYLSFFDMSGNHLYTTNYDPDQQYMEELKSLNSHNKGNPRTYIGNMHADDQYIYAVKGNDEGEIIDMPVKNEILIFDWNGLPVKKVLLDRFIAGVIFDHENKMMYGYAPYEEDYTIIKYDMANW